MSQETEAAVELLDYQFSKSELEAPHHFPPPFSHSQNVAFASRISSPPVLVSILLKFLGSMRQEPN